MAVPMTVDAASLYSYSNSSLSDSTHEVLEPMTVVHRSGGVDWYVSAYIKTDHPNDPSHNHRINASYNQNLQGSWTPVELPLYNPYDPPAVNFTQSQDPVLLSNTSDVSMHVVGITYSGSAQSTTNLCQSDNQVSLWTSYNGGQSWSYPVRIHRNGVGAGRFADKPAALVSKYSTRAGKVFIAFNDSFVGCTGSAGAGSIIRFYSFDPSTGTASLLASPISGYNVTNPVIYEDPSNGTLYLSAMKFDGTPGIVFFTSSNGGSSWTDTGAPGTITDSGLLPGGSLVCSNNNECAGASFGMTGKFDPVYGSIVVVFHRRKDTNGAEVMFTRGLPGRWFTPANISSNTTDYSWHPTLAFDGLGNALVTYYDYDHGSSPTQLRYVVKSSQIAAGMMSASGETTLFDASQPSVPVPTYYVHIPGVGDLNQAALGEYQDVFFWNSNFYAVTVYMKNGVGNIYHLRILP